MSGAALASVTEAIVQGICRDLDDRKGLHLSDLEPETQREILDSWREIVMPEIARAVPRSAAVAALLRTIVKEVERVSVPFTAREAAADAPVYQEHHRAIGALAVLVGHLAIELGQPELHDRTMAAIGLPVKA